MIRKFLLLISFFVVRECLAVPPTRIACIGNSITYGARIKDREKDAYPAQLQRLLGNEYQVGNYGVNSSTLLLKGNKPYIQQPAYQQALQFNPDIVFIKLGTNDSKLVNRVYLEDFVTDYHNLIQSFRALPSHPRIVLLLPIKAFTIDSNSISDKVIIDRIIPLTRQVAYDEQLEVVDLYSLFADKESLLPDKVHPNEEGAGIIAERLAELLTATRDLQYNVLKKLPVATVRSSFYGFNCNSFMMGNRNCKIVQPKWSAPGHPWIWRARFWGVEPQTDIALLERGFHVVYCDVVELYGNAEAVKAWDSFYRMLKRMGLSRKTVLEGMSRGAVYVYNWAAENPTKVACVYVDNPVLDLKSWPAGLGHSPASKKELANLMQDYHLATNYDLQKFHNSPIDKVEAIVKGKYPMLHLLADDDETVAPSDNTLLFEEKVKALGGQIIVLHKPGFKHHPHSLPNPTPIVSFILKNTINKQDDHP